MSDAPPHRPLRVAALVKQIPVGESMTLGPDGRLRRDGVELEMNAYCRRAVSKGAELAGATGGSCTVFTLGPSSAEDVLREAVAWGADAGVHLCDLAFAGSDTLATARALAAALDLFGPFDLVLVGRNSLDGDTGQVGPEVAQLCDLPFATGVRELRLEGEQLALVLEHDDGSEDVSVSLPCVLSVAERLCEPAKVPPEGRAEVPADKLRVVTAAELGPGPWGQAGSPTVVGSVRASVHDREQLLLSGPVDEQVAQAMAALERRGALELGSPERAGGATGLAGLHEVDPGSPVVLVVAEADRVQVGRELTGAAARLAAEIGGRVVAVCPAGHAGGPDGAGAHQIVELDGPPVAEDVADAVVALVAELSPWAVLVPGTAFGREVAGRAAAAVGAGLVGDAIDLHVADGVLVAAKPAFSGAMVADITCTSPVQMATVRPGVLPVPPAGPGAAVRSRRPLGRRGRVTVHASRRDDDVEVLARASAVIGVGSGVQPDEYPLLSPLAALLGAELGATRKVTDKGWAPRARQIGITGRSIAPRLYVALGLSGKFNHMVGVRSAGTILAVNQDPDALVFGHADVGLVGDWHQVVPALEDALRRRSAVGQRSTSLDSVPT